MKPSSRGRKGKSSISFSIAGIRAASKPQTQASVPPPPPPLPPIVTGNDTSLLTFPPVDDTDPTFHPAVAEATNRTAAVPQTCRAKVPSATTSADMVPAPSQRSPKYPGRGKLTIVKKGNASDKSVIRRVPVTDTLYDSSDNDELDDGESTASSYDSAMLGLLLQDDDEILMDHLDAEITRAEESELLHNLDDEITAAEEADLMRRLLVSIHHAEYMEKCQAKSAMVLQYEEQTTLLQRRKIPPPSSPISEHEFLPTWGEAPAERVQGVLHVQFGHVTKTLPKYVDQEHTILAFSISEFYTGVIIPVEHEVREADPTLLAGWDVSLRKNEKDPFSYLLEARGPKAALDRLKQQTESWIRSRINMINCQRLLYDGESVVLDIFVISKIDEVSRRILKTDFETTVTQTIKEELQLTNPALLSGWKVKMVKWDGRPDPCVIEVTGKQEVLKHFGKRAQQWVMEHAGFVDSKSIRVQSLSDSKLGITFMFKLFAPLGYRSQNVKFTDKQIPLRYRNFGVWLYDIKGKTSLATAMGGADVYEFGCSILAVNGRDCNTPAELKELYLKARDGKGVKLTLCLSKYANFSSIPDLSLMNPRRLDGKPFEKETYTKIRLQKLEPVAICTDDLEATTYLEYPPAGSPKPPLLPRTAPKTEIERDAAILDLLANSNNVEIDLEFSASELLGAVSHVATTCDIAGLWIHSFKEKGQLVEALGQNACKHGFVLLKANGMIIQSRKEADGKIFKGLSMFSQIKENAVGGGGTFRITLVVYDGTDLSGIDKSKLVQGGGRVNPRRRSGEHYPLHLLPLEEESSSGSDSSSVNGISHAATFRGKSKKKEHDCSIAKKKKTQNKEKPSTTAGKISSKASAKTAAGIEENSKSKTVQETNVTSNSDGMFSFDSVDVPSESDSSAGSKSRKLILLKNKRKVGDPLEDSDNEDLSGIPKRKRKKIAKKKSDSADGSSRKGNEGDKQPPRTEKALKNPTKKHTIQSVDIVTAPAQKKMRTLEMLIPRKVAPSDITGTSVPMGTSIVDTAIPRKKTNLNQAQASLSTIQNRLASDKTRRDPATPRSPFMEFAESRRADVKAQYPRSSKSEIENRLRIMWNAVPEEGKQIYRDKATAANNQTVVQETRAGLEVDISTAPADPPTSKTVTTPNMAASESVGASPSQPQNLSRKRAVLNYGNFKKAYRTLVEIEYGSWTRISTQKVFSYMWSKHKQLMGEDSECDSACTCFTMIQEMTEQFVDKFVLDQKEQGAPIESASCLKTSIVGFVNHFVPRFYGLLCKQYPNEHPKELLHRLVTMWPAHQKQRIYGDRCRANCECEGGWDVVFGKGDPKAVAAKRKEIPRSVSDQSLASSTNKQPAAGRNGEGQKISRVSTLLKKYDVTFEPCQASMGAFFKTDNGRCKIMSIFKKGSTRKDPRIQPGTFVVAARLGDREQAITTHDDLKKLYLRAKANGTKLDVTFINSEVATQPFDANSDQDWTEYGRWNNRIDGGWAGGAKTKKGLAALLKSSQTSRNANRPRNDIPPGADAKKSEEKSTNDENIDSSVVDETAEVTWVSMSTQISPQHRTQRLSLLGIRKDESSRSTGEGKSVSFTTSETTKHFVPGTAATEWAVPSHVLSRSITCAHHNNEKKLSPEDAVKDAVQRAQCSKLIQVLEEGASTNSKVMTTMLRARDSVKTSLKAIREQVKKDPTNSRLNAEVRDLEAKRVVLHIYINVCPRIEHAMALQHTSNLEIRIKSVELDKKPGSETIGRTNLLTGRVTIKGDYNNDELGSLPQRKATEFVNYDDTNDEKIFMATNNAQRTLEKRSLFINLREGAQGDAVPSAKLGTVTIPLNEIEERCDGNEQYVLRKEITPGLVLSKGTIVLAFRRRRIDKDYIMREKELLCKKLNEQLENIQRFNKEQSDEATVKLTANIRGIANTSFLHAAINLRQEGMVKRLLQLGANPHEKSTNFGTPISMAMKCRDRVREKLQRHISSSEPDSVTDPQHELHELFARIFQLLKPQETSQQLPDDIAQSMEEDLVTNGNAFESAEDREQLQRDFETFKEIFDRAPATAGGTDDGLEANKAFVGSSLRLNYKKQCPTRDIMLEFLQKAIANKLVIPISNTKLKLGSIGDGLKEASRAEPPDLPPLPELKKEWLYDRKRVCRTFPGPNGCKLGRRCRFVHIYRLPTDYKWKNSVFEAPDLLSPPYRFKVDERSLRVRKDHGWFTAGYFYSQNNVYYFAEGKNGKLSRHGVYWFRTADEAIEAMERVMSASMLKKAQSERLLCKTNKKKDSRSAKLSSTRDSAAPSSEQEDNLPMLDDIDWMEKTTNFERCDFAATPKACPEKAKNRCLYWHVHERAGNTMGHNMIKVFLDPDDVYVLKRKDFFTAAYTDRFKKSIIYVEGGRSRANLQGVHWYTTESEARQALERVVSAVRAQKH